MSVFSCHSSSFTFFSFLFLFFFFSFSFLFLFFFFLLFFFFFSNRGTALNLTLHYNTIPYTGFMWNSVASGTNPVTLPAVYSR